MTRIFTIEIDDDALCALQEEPEEMAREMRLFAAIKWYELGRITQGKAAGIAGISRSEFISELSLCKVTPFQESAKEISRRITE